MKVRRLKLACALVALPAVALTAAGVWFMSVPLPKIAATERGRETREYRAAAVALAKDPSAAAWRGAREPLGRERGKVTRPDESRASWGYAPEPDGRILVWVADADGKSAVGTRVDEADVSAVSSYLCVAVPLALLFFDGLTLLCIAVILRTAKAQDDYLAATAHDLTTPLVGLRHLVGRDDAEAKAVVERMLRLVANLKDFLKLGGRRPAPRCDTFAIGAAFDAAYALFAADYAEEASGPVAVSGDRSLAVCADETLVVQILWNLLGNDLKYAAPFGPVTVAFAAAQDRVTVSFADEGPGMKPRAMRRAFDRYYRAKTALESGKGGFGIGLCTAREFARAMGGDLTVKANSPHGCVFTLTLPVAAAGDVPRAS